ncbi:MAG: polysaccharide biosynthesis/export family protein [Planctomycetota bacterium]
MPLKSPGTAASCLPDEFRTPIRGTAPRLNLANVSSTPPTDYLLGPGDSLMVLVPGMFENTTVVPFTVRVASDGSVVLPTIGKVLVANETLGQAQETIEQAYADSILRNPQVNVSLAARATESVSVVGEVRQPGAFDLPKYENDIAHAIARAGGLTPQAAERIEVHRHATWQDISEILKQPPPASPRGEKLVLEIPLRGQGIVAHLDGYPPQPKELSAHDVRLRAGDVVVVPRRTDQVFFVVGPLNRTNIVNFSVQDEDRQLGNAFLLPNDRDIDVVTAVAMAGYIDPIDSPSTVTVHRSIPGQSPLLIKVDLIAARYDWQENVYVEAGDILYLDPDMAWWWRRMFDRIAPDLFTIPYRATMNRWLDPGGNY